MAWGSKDPDLPRMWGDQDGRPGGFFYARSLPAGNQGFQQVGFGDDSG